MIGETLVIFPNDDAKLKKYIDTNNLKFEVQFDSTKSRFRESKRKIINIKYSCVFYRKMGVLPFLSMVLSTQNFHRPDLQSKPSLPHKSLHSDVIFL